MTLFAPQCFELLLELRHSIRAQSRSVCRLGCPRFSRAQAPHRGSLMTHPKFDQDFWEQLWSKTLREHADKLAHRPPNAHLMAEAANLPPGRALDAGCGHGADTLWLAAHSWQVTAVDFSAAALAHGRSMAEAAGADIAERIV